MEGVETDAAGLPTGRLFRLDAWLRRRMADDRPNELAAVGRRLGSFGVTGVTDCTPTPTAAYYDTLAEAVRTGALPLTVAVTGGPELSDVHPPPPLRRGPVKIVIADHPSRRSTSSSRGSRARTDPGGQWPCTA